MLTHPKLRHSGVPDDLSRLRMGFANNARMVLIRISIQRYSAEKKGPQNPLGPGPPQGESHLLTYFLAPLKKLGVWCYAIRWSCLKLHFTRINIHPGQQLVTALQETRHAILIEGPAGQHRQIIDLCNQQFDVAGLLLFLQRQNLLHNRT